MFESPQAIIFVDCPPFNCVSFLLASNTVVLYWAFSESILSGILIMNHHLFDKFLDLLKLRVMFVQFILEIISILLVVIYQSFHNEQLGIQLVVRIYLYN